tara:strand:- start:761 stop:940 length:180 start_codon:yes stop_codon:yes gene_type:complete
MYHKYISLIVGTIFIINIIFIYMMISGQWFDFFNQLKWFLRIAAPFIIVCLFYLGMKKK